MHRINKYFGYQTKEYNHLLIHPIISTQNSEKVEQVAAGISAKNHNQFRSKM